MYIFATFRAVGVYADEPERLVNGIPINIEQYPQAVSIQSTQNSHMCGGSIISSLHILTAAHCVEPLIKNDRLRQSVTIVSGTTMLNSGGQAHRISRMWYHESYNPNAPGRDAGFDIGLIKVRI